MPPPRKSMRQASREAWKQMQLISQSAYDENEDEGTDPTETFNIAESDEEVQEADQEAPPKKKPKLSARKSGDLNEEIPEHHDEVPKTPVVHEELTLDAWVEDLSDVQKATRLKLEEEYKELTAKIEQITKSAEVIFQGEIHSAFELENSIPPLIYTTPDAKKKANAVKTKTPSQNLVLQSNKSNSSTPNSYQLVMDPRLGLIVGTMTPTTTASPPIPAQTTPTQSPTPTRQTRQRGKTTPTLSKATKPAVDVRTVESPAITITPRSKGGKASNAVVDLTSEENTAARPAADSKEISFNKLQGKTFPSLVVVARPHLSVKDISGGDRTKLDAKVKGVLMYQPTKFIEWLIQQGLIRAEQSCANHPTTKLKLGMYSDTSKFPYSGGYVWISECCPSRFVSVFSGSMFEGSSHPPSVILKLIYHWACQTNVQNVVQWVKVDNLYVKGINTLVRGICTAALCAHLPIFGGAGKRVEIGVISLGTTTQDGSQRQVKVEVLGVLESDAKHIRLRAIEPQVDGDRNHKKRFSKILEPLNEWVHKDSIIITDLTVDKQTLLSMGFTNIQQSTSTDTNNSNQTIMEYLRRIVPRMFQNTLSLLSRQIIQQFLDELVWREWFGTTAVQCYENILLHISEQTRTEQGGESLIMRLNKVAANPFKNWNFKKVAPKTTINKPIIDKTPNDKKALNRSTKKIININTSRDSTSPEHILRTISPDVPEQLVPLESYYYGTIDAVGANSVKINWNLKCSMCKSQFSNNIKLMTHLFTHAHNVSGNVYQCQYCLSSVGTHDGLVKHISASHPLETKFNDGFVCIICEQRFANTFSLGKHLSKEHVPAELPYNCGTCTFRCSSHRQAIEHFYSKHDSGSTIQCPFCLKSTTIVSSGRILAQNLNFFLQHLQKHQKKALARKCAKCALWFINKDTLREHQTNMHLSQRSKSGLVSWVSPRNGIMVPKSKTDKQVWEDSERELDVSNITINNLSNKSLCKECKTQLKSPGHLQSLGGCSNQNCQYETCCKKAMEHHTKICKDLNASLPIFTLPKEMFCICGYSDTDGNTLAKHLAQCERKSAYPSAEIAKKAIKNHSMLDVLGLVRRPEEPLKSTPVVDLVELDEKEEVETSVTKKTTVDTTSKKKEHTPAKDVQAINKRKGEIKTTTKTSKRKREEEIVPKISEKRKRQSLDKTEAASAQTPTMDIDNVPQDVIAKDSRDSNDIQLIELDSENTQQKSDDEPMQTDTVVTSKDAQESLVSQQNPSLEAETIVLDDDIDEIPPKTVEASNEDSEMDADVTVIENTSLRPDSSCQTPETDSDIPVVEDTSSQLDEIKELSKENDVVEAIQDENEPNIAETSQISIDVEEGDVQTEDNLQQNKLLTPNIENTDSSVQIDKLQEPENLDLHTSTVQENNEIDRVENIETIEKIEDSISTTSNADVEMPNPETLSAVSNPDSLQDIADSVQNHSPQPEVPTDAQQNDEAEIDPDQSEIQQETPKLPEVEEDITDVAQTIEESHQIEEHNEEVSKAQEVLDHDLTPPDLHEEGAGQLDSESQHEQNETSGEHTAQESTGDVQKSYFKHNEDNESTDHQMKDTEQIYDNVHLETDDIHMDTIDKELETPEMPLEVENIETAGLGQEPEINKDEGDHEELQQEPEIDTDEGDHEELQQESKINTVEGDNEEFQQASEINTVEGEHEGLQQEPKINTVEGEHEELQQEPDINTGEGEHEELQQESEINTVEDDPEELQQTYEINTVESEHEELQQESEINTVEDEHEELQQEQPNFTNIPGDALIEETLETQNTDEQPEELLRDVEKVAEPDDECTLTLPEYVETIVEQEYEKSLHETESKSPELLPELQVQETVLDSPFKNTLEEQDSEIKQTLSMDEMDSDQVLNVSQPPQSLLDLEENTEILNSDKVESDSLDLFLPQTQFDSISNNEIELPKQDNQNAIEKECWNESKSLNKIASTDDIESSVANLLGENPEETSRNSEMVINSIDDDVEENIENIQKELFGYQTKRPVAMDVDLPDIFEELDQNTMENSTPFDNRMVVDNAFDSAMTGIECNEDNTKMLEEFMDSIQTDTL